MAAISVLVPAYNAQSVLPQCLDSLLAQTFEDFELLVINDGSTDGTADVLRRYATRDARVRFIEQPNRGLAATRNAAVREARAPLIAFVDADDWVDAEYLAYLMQVRKSTGCALSGCNHLVETGAGSYPRYAPSEKIERLTLQQAYDGVLYHGVPDVSAWAKLCDRDVMLRLDYPAGRLFEDTFRIAELLALSDGIGVGYRPLYHYRYSDTSISKRVARDRVWDMMDAVEHMTAQMGADPAGRACVRRRVHAALSTLRLRVTDGQPDWSRAFRTIRRGAWTVLTDPRAPGRDKLGVLASFGGKAVYDGVWRLYSSHRRRY